MELAQRPHINWEKSWLVLFTASAASLSLDIPRACEICSNLVARAEEHGSPEQRGTAEVQLAMVRMLAGDFDLAVAGFDRAIALHESTMKFAAGTRQYDQTALYYRTASRAIWGLSLWILGYPERALKKLDSAILFAQECDSKGLLEYAEYVATMIYACRGEFDHSRESALAALALATELGDVPRGATVEVLLGWLQTIEGDLDGGISRMRRSLIQLRTTGAEGGIPWLMALLATALGRTGDFVPAARLISEAFATIERTGERNCEADVRRMHGELLLAQDASNAAQAEQSFRTAIEIARRQHAKSWELRATTSLARLLGKQGNRDEARTMLSEICNWFTEGFDTADMKDAKSLLEELSV
jgi:tetratricopeptide (TPR) repeat protein